MLCIDKTQVEIVSVDLTNPRDLIERLVPLYTPPRQGMQGQEKGAKTQRGSAGKMATRSCARQEMS